MESCLYFRLLIYLVKPWRKFNKFIHFLLIITALYWITYKFNSRSSLIYATTTNEQKLPSNLIKISTSPKLIRVYENWRSNASKTLNSMDSNSYQLFSLLDRNLRSTAIRLSTSLRINLRNFIKNFGALFVLFIYDPDVRDIPNSFSLHIMSSIPLLLLNIEHVETNKTIKVRN